jgi:hypothetical protein
MKYKNKTNRRKEPTRRRNRNKTKRISSSKKILGQKQLRQKKIKSKLLVQGKSKKINYQLKKKSNLSTKMIHKKVQVLLQLNLQNKHKKLKLFH